MHSKIVQNSYVCSMGFPDALKSGDDSSIFSLSNCDNLVQQWMPLCQTGPLDASNAGWAAGASPASDSAVDKKVLVKELPEEEDKYKLP